VKTPVPPAPLRRRLLATAAGAALSARASAQSVAPGARAAEPAVAVKAVDVARGLEHPWGLAFLPDGRLLVTERAGRLRVVGRDGRLSAPLAGVPRVVARGQGGLLDVALSPSFEADRQVYLSFAEPADGGARTAVARATLAEEGLRETTVIFRQKQARAGANHFGSRLVLTRDGHLFITMGDRYDARDQVQDLGTHFGKIVRVRTDGTVPPDNPFVNTARALPDIWSFGHRNVQGAALHPGTGRLWAHEHGAMGGDEVNVVLAGRNYGWPVITHGVDYSGAKIGEGSAKAGMEQPQHVWVPSIAPSGMAFVTGSRLPGWRGSLVVGSLKFRLLARLSLDAERVVGEQRVLQPLGERLRDVRQGPDGHLYLLTDETQGAVLRVEPA
jgi:glucose/arabinose dehydrogenase